MNVTIKTIFHGFNLFCWLPWCQVTSQFARKTQNPPDTSNKSGHVIFVLDECRYCHEFTLFGTLLIIRLQVFSDVTGLLFM